MLFHLVFPNMIIGCGHRIVAAIAIGVAANDSLQAQYGAVQKPVVLYGLKRIVGAARRKAAAGTDQGGEKPLVTGVQNLEARVCALLIRDFNPSIHPPLSQQARCSEAGLKSLA